MTPPAGAPFYSRAGGAGSTLRSCDRADPEPTDRRGAGSDLEWRISGHVSEDARGATMRSGQSTLSPRARARSSHGSGGRFRRLGVRVLRILGRLAGPVVVGALDRAAKHSVDRGDYVTAAALYRRAVAALAKAPSERSVHRLRAQSLGSLATLARIQGRYDKADRLFRRALAIAEEAFGPGDLGLAVLLNGQAVLYKYQGRFEK